MYNFGLNSQFSVKWAIFGDIHTYLQLMIISTIVDVKYSFKGAIFG